MEDFDEYLLGEELVGFLGFYRKMLQWAPEDRNTASQLLRDPWLRGS
jgi:serine/threonine-protein kinase SRPK3